MIGSYTDNDFSLLIAMPEGKHICDRIPEKLNTLKHCGSELLCGVYDLDTKL